MLLLEDFTSNHYLMKLLLFLKTVAETRFKMG